MNFLTFSVHAARRNKNNHPILDERECEKERGEKTDHLINQSSSKKDRPATTLLTTVKHLKNLLPDTTLQRGIFLYQW